MEAARLYIWEQHAAAEAPDGIEVHNDGWLIQRCIVGFKPLTIESYSVHHTWDIY